jgi:hypothetical protein
MVNIMYSYRTKVEDVKMACVPHALSEVSGLSFGFVLPYCIEHGWNEEIGMYINKIEECAHKLGIELRCMHPNELGETWSTTRLDTSKDYILHTPGHVFAICCGNNRNLNDTHPDKELRTCWEVVKKPEWCRPERNQCARLSSQNC